MRLTEWEVSQGGYQRQNNIPNEKRDLASQEWINTKNKPKSSRSN
jgi:hypothetical protein